MANENEEKVVDAKAEKTEEKKEQKSASVNITLKTISLILSLASLGLTLIWGVLAQFGVYMGVGQGVFFLLAIGLAITGMVFAFINSKSKLDMTLGFCAFAILITVLMYF